MEHLGKPLDLGRACASLGRQAGRKLLTVTLAVHRCLGVEIFVYAAVGKKKKTCVGGGDVSRGMVSERASHDAFIRWLLGTGLTVIRAGRSRSHGD